MPTEEETTVFLFVTGAGSCVQTPRLIQALVAQGYTVYSVLTPNVAQVTAPALLMDVPGNHWIHTYQQPPLARYPFGTLLVAPCTFNTLNKIALGLADNLATAMIADGLGAGNRVVIAPSMNRGLWAHPQTQASLTQLQSWGCTIVPPQVTAEQVTMAAISTMVAALGHHPTAATVA
ncbi:MAG: flavoprotein [Caldilineaceae bacterium]|nr:flavoprotein [Caldilineaceae bacterium]